jgi:hypothetical protein
MESVSNLLNSIWLPWLREAEKGWWLAQGGQEDPQLGACLHSDDVDCGRFTGAVST